MLYGLFDGGWILLVLLGLFYFLILPVLVFSLMSRVRQLEQSKANEGSPRAVATASQPLRTPVPSAEMNIRPPSKPKPAPTTRTSGLSLEEKVGGRVFQWVGIGALALALLFFLKWSFDNGFIGPVGRTLIGYVLSAAAILAGDRLRTRYGIWSLAFTGGGALGSYIVTSIALHVYELFPSPVAMVIYVLTTFVVCVLSGYYGSLPLAIFGIAGGFLTPVLIGGGGNTLGLLSYILILDLGVLGLSHVRQWRGLNAFCLMGTGVYEVYALLDLSFDRSYAFAFLGAFLFIYILVPYIYNLLRQQKSDAPDIFILVGNTFLHFGLILAWLSRTIGLMETYDALVSLSFAVLFLVFASEVFHRNRKDTPLVLGSLGLAVLFTTLMVPLQLGGAWVPLAWSVEGAFLLWAAMILRDIRIQRFAWLVMGAAYVWYFFVPSVPASGRVADYYVDLSPYVVYQSSGLYLFLAWAALLAGFTAVGLTRDDRREQQVVPFVLFGLAVLAVAFLLNVFGFQESSLSGVQRFIEAAAMIGGGYTVLFLATRHWSSLSMEERRGFSALGIGIQLITLAYLTREFIRAVDEGWLLAGVSRRSQIMNVGISILWALYGSATLIIGIVKRLQPLRVFSLVLLLIAMAKLALVDFFSLGTGARVIGFTVLGGLLVAASFLYQSNKAAVKSLFLSSSDR